MLFEPLYRVAHLVVHLGWVDLEFESSTVLPNCPAAPAKFPPAQAESGRQWNTQISSQPNPGARPDEPPCINCYFKLYENKNRVSNGKNCNLKWFKYSLRVIVILVRGGLTLREAMTLLEDCHATGLVRAVDLVEVNTDLAASKKDADLTLDATHHVILAAMGC